MILRYHSMSCVCAHCLMEDTIMSPEYGGGAGDGFYVEIKVITK